MGGACLHVQHVTSNLWIPNPFKKAVISSAADIWYYRVALNTSILHKPSLSQVEETNRTATLYPSKEPTYVI